MGKIILVLIFIINAAAIMGQTNFQKDFLFYWETIDKNFAYFDRQKTDWQKVKYIFQPIADTIKTKKGFIQLLEAVNNELYNGHIFLNVNTGSSNRLIPSGADLKLSYEDNKFVISEIREGFNSDLCGLKIGMTVTMFNDIPVETAVQKFLPQSINEYDREMYEYAGNMLLAGSHDIKRKITIDDNGTEKTFYPDNILNKTDENPEDLLESKILDKNIGYIKINNSLGNSNLIEAFDTALDSMMNTAGLIIDLRETPGGGTTTIARAIMGRFIEAEMPYQKHIYISEEKETGIKRSALELVSPRNNIYKKPVAVLAGYWTGSMGEGIAIGFDGLKRAKIAGTKMAGLLGEIFTFETPENKIPFSFPCVKLQHVNGQPREDFVPGYYSEDTKNILDFGIELLTTKKN